MCLCRLSTLANVFSQCVHWNFSPPWTDFICFWRVPFWLNDDPHWMHWTFWLSWIVLMCVWRFDFRANKDPHCVHWGFWSSGTNSLWIWSFLCAIFKTFIIWGHWIQSDKIPCCQYQNLNSDFPFKYTTIYPPMSTTNTIETTCLVERCTKLLCGQDHPSSFETVHLTRCHHKTGHSPHMGSV